MSSLYGGGPAGVGASQKFAGRDLVRVPRFDQGQTDAYQQAQALSGPDSFTAKMAQGDPSFFEKMEAPALSQFGQLQGNIASRFSGMGGMGARNTGGFQNTMSAAGSDLAQQLQGNRVSYQQNAVKQLMEMYHSLMNENPYDQFLMNPAKKRKWWESLLGIGAPIAGAVGGGIIGGPMGAAAGGGLGSSFANSIMGNESPSMDWSGISKLPRSWS